MGNFVSSLEKPGPVVGFIYHNEMGLLYWGLCLFKMMVGICDFFLDLIFGYTITKGTREEQEMAREYENSAQIASIMGRGSYTLLMNHQLHHFSLRPDILFLKHACSILIQSSNPACGFSMMAHRDLAWLYRVRHTEVEPLNIGPNIALR